MRVGHGTATESKERMQKEQWGESERQGGRGGGNWFDACSLRYG